MYKSVQYYGKGLCCSLCDVQFLHLCTRYICNKFYFVAAIQSLRIVKCLSGGHDVTVRRRVVSTNEANFFRSQLLQCVSLTLKFVRVYLWYVYIQLSRHW